MELSTSSSKIEKNDGSNSQNCPNADKAIKASRKFFTSSEAVSKSVFIEAYRVNVFITSLLTCPFGHSDFLEAIIGEEMYSKSIMEIYKQWEETIARRIYLYFGIPDDKVAATLHKLVNEDKDAEMINEVNKTNDILYNIINPPKVVEYDFPGLSYENYSILTARLLNQVLVALKNCFEEILKCYSLDENVPKDILIRHRLINPGDLNLRTVATKSLSKSSLKLLEDSLSISLPDSTGEVKCYNVSIIQFHSLLKTYGNTSDVNSVIASLCDSIEANIDHYRYDYLSTLLPTADPRICLLMAAERKDSAYFFLIKYVQQVLNRAIALKEEEKFIVAAKLLSTLLLRENFIIEGRVEQEDAETEENYFADLEVLPIDFVLPMSFQIEILLLQADCLLQQLNEYSPEEDIVITILRNCNEVLDLDNRCISAYVIRAKVFSLIGSYDEASIDSLAAFLIGGSIDLSLAAVAEETARESCRLESKQIFQKRIEALQSLDLNSLCLDDAIVPSCPLVQRWLVKSYFGASILLSDAFSILPSGYGEVFQVEGDIDESSQFMTPPMNMYDKDCVMQESDGYAYNTLRNLVEIFDSMILEIDDECKSVDVDTSGNDESDISMRIINCSSCLNIVDAGVAVIVPKSTSEELVDIQLDSSKRVCKELVMSLDLLRSPQCVELTGVCLSHTGQVKTIRKDHRKISSKILSRLLSVIASIAYICGDSSGAIECFRLSTQLDSLLEDSFLKLAALLVDMDEVNEAKQLLDKVADSHEFIHPYVELHCAEISIHQCDFQAAVRHLQQAQRSIKYIPFLSNDAVELISKFECFKNIAISKCIEDRREKSVENLEASIQCLLGVSFFRLSPEENFEKSMSLLENGIDEFPDNIFLAISYGEVLSQAGDLVRAIQSFATASKIDVSNPLPFTSAARVYAQMNLKSDAEYHLHHAQQLDESLAMTKVDIAQQLAQNGETAAALEMLDQALQCARHVSEIRDVLTYRRVAEMTLELETKGVHIPLISSSEFI